MTLPQIPGRLGYAPFPFSFVSTPSAFRSWAHL